MLCQNLLRICIHTLRKKYFTIFFLFLCLWGIRFLFAKQFLFYRKWPWGFCSIGNLFTQNGGLPCCLLSWSSGLRSVPLRVFPLVRTILCHGCPQPFQTFLFKRLRCFLGLDLGALFLFIFFMNCNFRNEFAFPQPCRQQCCQLLIQNFSIGKTQFHLVWMYVDIHQGTVQRNRQHCKRIFVLHHKSPVSIFQCFCNQSAFDISSVDKITFKIPVASCNNRLSDKTIHRKSLIFRVNFQQICRNISSINVVNDILQFSISGSMQTDLTVVNKFKGDFRMRQCDAFHQIIDISCLSLGWL